MFTTITSRGSNAGLFSRQRGCKMLMIVLCVLQSSLVLFVYLTNSSWKFSRGESIAVTEDRPHDQAAMSATSGKLFKMDQKLRTFTDATLSTIRVAASGAGGNKVKFSKRCKSDRWIVLTTIFNVTSAILDYNHMRDWCTVVAGDRKSMDKAQYNRYLNTDKVVYLDVAEQRQIFVELNALKTYDVIPFNHFGRKNLGFLYAIMNGAKYIYDTDDDNKVIGPWNQDGIPILGASQQMKNGMDIGIKEIADARVQDELTFNVFLLWSNEFIWPRGYDVAALTDSFKWHKSVALKEYSGDKQKSDGDSEFIIQQWLSNIEPDYDALERLIGKNIDWNDDGKFRMQYLFDIDRSPNGNNFALSVPNHLYVPFNAQMTIWEKRSFLFLYLPITVHGRVSDIWRSYFAQAVMHTLSVHGVADWKLLYCPVLVNQYRNSHNYLADFQSELPLYLQTHELLRFLHRFATQYPIGDVKNANVGQILLDLYIALYEYGVVELEDVKGIHFWINDIVNTIGWNASF